MWNKHLEYNGASHCKVIPFPVDTRWNSWFNSISYIAEVLDYLKSFFLYHCEAWKDSENVIKVMSLINNDVVFEDIRIKLWFTAESTKTLVSHLESFQARKSCATEYYHQLNLIRTYLELGTSKPFIGPKTKLLLEKIYIN